MRIREARGEESREQNSEWAPVVPNMEAGGSHLQTTDPRNMVENIAMDDLEEKIGRSSVGLGRERERECARVRRMRPMEKEKEHGSRKRKT